MPRETRSSLHRPDEIANILAVCRSAAGRSYCREGAPDNHLTPQLLATTQQILLRQTQFFCIELICCSISATDIRQILRSRPDLAQTLSPNEVAERWLMLCPSLRITSVSPEPPTKLELRSLTRSKKRIHNIRRQLSDVSWWMRLLCQTIAQRANALDGLDGPVHRGRFRSVRLPDDDLNSSDLSTIDLAALPLGCSDNLTPSSLRQLASQITSHARSCRASTVSKQQPLGTDRLFAASTYANPPEIRLPVQSATQPNLSPAEFATRPVAEQSSQAWLAATAVVVSLLVIQIPPAVKNGRSLTGRVPPFLHRQQQWPCKSFTSTRSPPDTPQRFSQRTLTRCNSNQHCSCDFHRSVNTCVLAASAGVRKI